MGETVDALGYKTDVKARAKDSLQDKKESVMGVAQSAKERLVGAGQSVGDATPDADQVKHQARRAKSVAQENPLGLAVGAIAVGFLAGMLIPSTRVEDERSARGRRRQGPGQADRPGGARARQAGRPGRRRHRQGERPEHADELGSTAQEHAQQAMPTS